MKRLEMKAGEAEEHKRVEPRTKPREAADEKKYKTAQNDGIRGGNSGRQAAAADKTGCAFLELTQDRRCRQDRNLLLPA